MDEQDLLCGFGINDADHMITKRIKTGEYYSNGREVYKTTWDCPYYLKWKNMIQRVYQPYSLKKQPSYIGCSVAEEFRRLSDFITWVDEQPERDWENLCLDKDLLFPHNSVYSPKTCIFVSNTVNTFVTGCGRGRGELMLGVTRNNSKVNPFRAKCSDPFKKRSRHAGVHSSELLAHLAWKERKHKYSCELAEIQSDPRLREALFNRYK